MKRKSTLICIVLFLLVLPAMAQSKEKSKYLGIYTRADPFKTDTLSQTAFFTHDSFLLVFTIVGDSDYLHPTYRGTWSLNDETAETELKYDNSTIKTAWFEEDDRTRSMNFYLDSKCFWQPRKIFVRGNKRK